MSTQPSKILKNEEFQELLLKLSNNLQLLTNSTGEVVGRACITSRSLRGNNNFYRPVYGVVTVGGFRASYFTGIAGVFIGKPYRASRDVGIPVVEYDVLRNWATKQADLVSILSSKYSDLEDCASLIRLCGGETGLLPVAVNYRGPVSKIDISKSKNLSDEIFLVQDAAISLYERNFGIISLNENVFVVGMGVPGLHQTGESRIFPNWPESLKIGAFGYTHRKYIEVNSLSGAVIEALAESWEVPLRDVLRQSDLSSKAKCEVGTCRGKPVTMDVYVIRKPKAPK